MSNAIVQVHGKIYINQKGISLYPTTGSADDWLYSDSANENNGEYRSASYTIELRDTGSYGFLLPPVEVRSHSSVSISFIMHFSQSDYSNWSRDF